MFRQLSTIERQLRVVAGTEPEKNAGYKQTTGPDYPTITT